MALTKKKKVPHKVPGTLCGIMFKIVPGTLLLLFFFILIPLNAQTVLLTSEIERLDRLTRTPAQKYDSLVSMARLYQLSGNSERALEYWTAAAASITGSNAAEAQKRDNALLEAAKLLISMGEFEKAAAEIRTILLGSRDENMQQSALYLNAQLEAFKTGDPSPLHYMMNTGMQGNQSGIIYTIWKITGDVSWKANLLNTYPRSVEAEIARGNSAINAATTPQWVFLSDYSPASAYPAVNQNAAGVSSVRLQTGLFGSEDNARRMAAELNRAGYEAQVSRRPQGDFWIVTVPSGSDVNQTISRLKNAGYDAFPVN